MLSRYHIEITMKSLESFFTPAPLREIIRANVRQDSVPSILGAEARRHVCDCKVVESFIYIQKDHFQIAKLVRRGGSAAAQRAALGRLLHTVQDFYAHTNYVALLVANRGGVAHTDTATMARIDPGIMMDPALQTAQWLAWREPFYYVPLVGDVLRRVWLPVGSHEAINLDSPKRGAHFYVAMACAHQHTRVEYARVLATLREVEGHEAKVHFHGGTYPVPHAAPVEV